MKEIHFQVFQAMDRIPDASGLGKVFACAQINGTQLACMDVQRFLLDNGISLCLFDVLTYDFITGECVIADSRIVVSFCSYDAYHNSTFSSSAQAILIEDYVKSMTFY